MSFRLSNSQNDDLNHPFLDAGWNLHRVNVMSHHITLELCTIHSIAWSSSLLWTALSSAIEQVIYFATISYPNDKNPPSLLILTCTCMANVRSPTRNWKLQIKQSWFCAVKLHEVRKLKRARKDWIDWSQPHFLPFKLHWLNVETGRWVLIHLWQRVDGIMDSW